MKIGLMTVAYNEERFIGPFLSHIPDWVDTKILLRSTRPWEGSEVKLDRTADIARKDGTTLVVESYWPTEHQQRNTGLDLLSDCDWVIVLDPDEFLDKENWDVLQNKLRESRDNALVVEGQYTYWKTGWVADPPKDYSQLIAARPSIRFADKRVVSSPYVTIPVWIHHFSWARTDEEVWNKISHYAHAQDFNTEDWFNTVWLTWQPGIIDVHPTTPSTLHRLIPAQLPKEIEELNLWPLK